MPTFELICLANSKKHGGRCVAGLRTDGGGWVRPVGPTPDAVLQPRHYRLDDGTEARVLDVVQIGCQEPVPKPHHPEDWVVDGTRWRLARRPATQEHRALLRRHLTTTSLLLENWVDRVPYDAYTVRPAKASLTLVAPERLEWVVKVNERGERRFRVRFVLKGRHYDLSLTDPLWEQRLNRLPLGTHPRGAVDGLRPDDEVLLTISLGEPFQADPRHDPCCYKLVAAVIALSALERGDAFRDKSAFAIVRARSTSVEALDPSAYPDPFPTLDEDDRRRKVKTE
jgi:hypothetical protein